MPCCWDGYGQDEENRGARRAPTGHPSRDRSANKAQRVARKKQRRR